MHLVLLFFFFFFFFDCCFQERDVGSSLARLGLKLCQLEEQSRVDGATNKATHKVDEEISYVGSNAEAIFEKILDTFDGNETKENIHDLGTLIATTTQCYKQEQLEIYANFLDLIGLQLKTQNTYNEEANDVKSEFEIRINGNASILKRDIVFQNIDCLHDVFRSYQSGGIDNAISYLKNIDSHEKMLSDLGINLSNDSLVQHGFSKHDSGIFDEKFIIFTLQQMFVENRGGETGVSHVLCFYVFNCLCCLLFCHSCFKTASKTMFVPSNMQRFINFLCPGSCKDNGNKIDFESLSKLNVRTIGVFGSKKEIIDCLKLMGFGTTAMYATLTHSNTTTMF